MTIEIVITDLGLKSSPRNLMNFLRKGKAIGKIVLCVTRKRDPQSSCEVKRLHYTYGMWFRV